MPCSVVPNTFAVIGGCRAADVALVTSQWLFTCESCVGRTLHCETAVSGLDQVEGLKWRENIFSLFYFVRVTPNSSYAAFTGIRLSVPLFQVLGESARFERWFSRARKDIRKYPATPKLCLIFLVPLPAVSTIDSVIIPIHFEDM